MKPYASQLLAAAVVAVSALGLMSSAHATWTFNNNGAISNDGSVGLNTVSGLSVTNGSNNAGFASGAKWATTALSYYPGIGISTDTTQAPGHAIDNNGNTEAVLFGFGSSVVLSNIGLSYTHDGATQGVSVDVSLFRYVGSGTPALSGVAPSAMTGWELVGNYGNMQQSNTNAVNGSNLGSSWWLVSAYNSGFGGSTSGLDNGNDYFKIASLNGSGCTSSANGACGTAPRADVPEPASLALVGIALLGVYGTRRRASAKAA